MVHFEIIGSDPRGLRDYYGRLFGWTFDTSGPVAPSVSDEGEYGFVDGGLPGGVGGGRGYQPRALFYVGVPDVEAALEEAERLGGTRASDPQRAPGGMLTVAHFEDPEGNLIGLAAVTRTAS